MKKLLLFLCTLQAFSCTNSPQDQISSIRISTFNHAEQLLKGTLIYTLSPDSIKVSVHSRIGNSDSNLWAEKTDKQFYSKLLSFRLDTLREFYDNRCILSTSGNEYSISITKNGKTTQSNLHHYFLKSVDLAFHLINENLPVEYKIGYVDSATNQNCD